MRITQKQIIVRYLQEVNDWVPAYRLRGIETPFGFIGHQGDRRCRELANEGKLQHKIEGAYAWYRAVAIPMRQFKVLGLNGTVEKVLSLPI